MPVDAAVQTLHSYKDASVQTLGVPACFETPSLQPRSARGPLVDVSPPPPRSHQNGGGPLLLGFALTDNQWAQVWAAFRGPKVPVDDLESDNFFCVVVNLLDDLSDKIGYYLENKIGLIDDDAPDSVKQAAKDCGDVEAHILCLCKDTNFEKRLTQKQFDFIKNLIAKAGIDQEVRWWTSVYY